MVGVLLPELNLNVPTPVLPHPFPCSAVRKKSGLNSSALTHLTFGTDFGGDLWQWLLLVYHIEIHDISKFWYLYLLLHK